MNQQELAPNLPYLREFLLNLENNNYSKQTVDNYLRDLEILASFLEYRRVKFADIDKLLISEYKGYLRNQNYIPILRKFKAGKEIDDEDEQKSYTDVSETKKALYRGQLSSRSVNRMLSSMRSYLNFLVDIDEEVPITPNAIKLIKTEKKEKQVAEMDDLIRLIECPMEFEKQKLVKFRNRAILEMIFSTGMRISEVVNLNRDQGKQETTIYDFCLPIFARL